MKRFLVFASHFHYPSGGMDDFVADFDDKLEALTQARLMMVSNDWSSIYDQELRREVVLIEQPISFDFKRSKPAAVYRWHVQEVPL